ncbi:hypothetical protein CDAR_604191 [Caerostris darwini]|uniref:Uncharacterized protein n=1 Tax=Caerostris darwini TaxID=1538125 RepID=A0AAV4SAM0_9ARAC|nr:hypothetical protein CDAR_604191 [Caerostris darwini]
MSSACRSNTKHQSNTSRQQKLNFPSKTSLKIIVERIGKQMLMLTTRYTCSCQTSQKAVSLAKSMACGGRLSSCKREERSVADVQEEFIPADFEIDDMPFSEEDGMSASDVDDMDSLDDLLALDDLSFLDEEDGEDNIAGLLGTDHESETVQFVNRVIYRVNQLKYQLKQHSFSFRIGKEPCKMEFKCLFFVCGKQEILMSGKAFVYVEHQVFLKTEECTQGKRAVSLAESMPADEEAFSELSREERYRILGGALKMIAKQMKGLIHGIAGLGAAKE